MNKSFGFFSYFSFTKYWSCILDIFRELSINVLLTCNMLTNMQIIIDFVVTKGLSKWVKIAIVQAQMQHALKGNAFERLFSFNIRHQFPTHQQSSLKIHDTFQYPNLILEWNIVTRSFECPSKPTFCKMLFGNFKLNFT